MVKNMFESSVMDMSWSRNGYSMMVCSLDGTVAFLSFSQEELGKAMSQEEKVSRRYLISYCGKNMAGSQGES